MIFQQQKQSMMTYHLREKEIEDRNEMTGDCHFAPLSTNQSLYQSHSFHFHYHYHHLSDHPYHIYTLYIFLLLLVVVW